MKDKDRSEPKNLRDILRDEKQRGASRYSVSKQKERQLTRDLQDLLQIADERENIEAIKKRGWMFPFPSERPTLPPRNHFAHPSKAWPEL